MKKLLFLLPIALITFSAAIPPQKTVVNPSSTQVPFPQHYKDAKVVLESIKGDKLSLKEKAALKVATSKPAKKAFEGGGKSQLVALLLCIFLGVLGIHRFYLGYTTAGIIQLLTGGGFGLWALIDLIRIITGGLKPKSGEYGETL